MKRITDLIVRVADLAEAEGRTLRAMVAQTALGLAWIAVGGVVVLIGLVLVLAAVYLAAADGMGPAGGAVVAGAVGLMVGGGLAWLGHRTAR